MAKNSRHKLDLRGAIIPFTLLKILQVFGSIQPGDTLEVFWNDPDAPKDLFKILPESSYDLLIMEESRDGESCCRIEIQKKSIETTLEGSLAQNILFRTTAYGTGSKQIKIEEANMSELDLNTIEAASIVDARGSACPGPLLEAKKGIGKVRVGEVLEIYSNDSGTRTDIPAWAKKIGHEYLGVVEGEGYDKHFVRRNK